MSPNGPVLGDVPVWDFLSPRDCRFPGPGIAAGSRAPACPAGFDFGVPALFTHPSFCPCRGRASSAVPSSKATCLFHRISHRRHVGSATGKTFLSGISPTTSSSGWKRTAKGSTRTLAPREAVGVAGGYSATPAATRGATCSAGRPLGSVTSQSEP